MTKAIEITINGREYVAIPKARYLRDSAASTGTVDALEFGRETLARDVRKAREAAGLTQAELAERMGNSQVSVSSAERGISNITERYVRRVLEACGLPEDWSPPKERTVRRR